MIKKVFNTDADRRRTVANLPVGTVMLWHNSTPPNGWLLCTGGEFPIASYTLLYNLITVNGTVFPYGSNTNGSGAAGSTHFKLPDMTDRFVMGAANTSAIGTTAGAETHSHNFTVSPSVTSNNSRHNHSFAIGNLQDGGLHTHDVNFALSSLYHNAATNVRRAATGNTTAAFMDHGHNDSATTVAGGNHSHNGPPTVLSNHDHDHSVTISFGNYTPTANHVPKHQRFYFIVFSG